ncbi:MAG: phage integrase N-terminal SAM-like domain-containing protein [Prevotellaceae bacterium]|jgi:site-specific recombinase XerD|nr:phage integrase N-terminal SAM-like domain-containing protein [Prevotellaceae bacterium]
MYANKFVQKEELHAKTACRFLVLYENSITNQVQNYLEYAKLLLAKKTIQNHKSKLKMFVEWLQQDLQVTEITRKMIVDYTIFLAQQNKARCTIDAAVDAISTFFNYLIDNEITEINPCEKIKRIGVIKDCAPAPLTKTDIEKIHNYFEKYNPQMWLACQFLYYCAIRPGSELRLLKISDIDFDNGIVQIKSHNAKNGIYAKNSW